MEFWSTVPDFIAQFEGLLGALLGAYAGFFGSYFTARHTQKIEMEKFDREMTRAAKDRTASGTAHFLDLVMKAGSQGLRSYEQTSEISHQLVLFSVREMHDHPNAAQWAHMQADEIRKADHPDQHFVALPWQVHRVSNQLFQWVREKYREDFFNIDSDEPIRQQMIDSLDPDLYVTRGESVDPTDHAVRKMERVSVQAGLIFVER